LETSDLKAEDLAAGTDNWIASKTSSDSGYRFQVDAVGTISQADSSGTVDTKHHSRNTVQTTDATATTIFIVNPGTDKTILVKALILGSSATGNVAAYEVVAVGRNSGGTMTILSSTVTVLYESDAAFDCTVDWVTSNLRIQVTGLLATTIDWVATVDYLYL